MTYLDIVRAIYFTIALTAVIMFWRIWRRKLGFEIICYAAIVTLLPGMAFMIARYFIHDTALLNFMSLMVYVTTALAWLLTAIALWQGSRGGNGE
jgi:uncharacterized membrane protein YjjP (DUF1212 family)